MVESGTRQGLIREAAVEPSIFLDFNLPKAATWFYFSLILSITLFFQFSRLLSVRNLDILTLFLLVPGFLLHIEAHTFLRQAEHEELLAAESRLPAAQEITSAVASLAGKEGLAGGFLRLAVMNAPLETLELTTKATLSRDRGQRELLFAYIWLLSGSAYWLIRALVDLALVRRPVMSPNLNTTGLGWLGLALAFCLTAVVYRPSSDSVVAAPIGARPIAIEQLQDRATAVVRQTQNGLGQTPTVDLRFWVQRSLAIGCHLAVVVGLFMIGLRHFQDLTTAMALGTLYLLLPYTAFHIAQLHLVWPAAFVTWAIYCYRRPVLSGWLLGLAGGSSFVTLLLFPLWVGFYSKRGAGRFAIAFLTTVGVSLGVLALALSWEGLLPANYLSDYLPDWIPWKQSGSESVWTGLHGAYRLPIFVLYVAFLAVVTIWPTPKNLSHLVSQSAAVLIGVQFWHADRGGFYILWYLPLILLMVFRPTLTAHEPPIAEPGQGRMLRWANAAWRRVTSSRSTSGPKELAV